MTWFWKILGAFHSDEFDHNEDAVDEGRDGSEEDHEGCGDVDVGVRPVGGQIDLRLGMGEGCDELEEPNKSAAESEEGIDSAINRNLDDCIDEFMLECIHVAVSYTHLTLPTILLV